MPVVKSTFFQDKWAIPVPYALEPGVPDACSKWIAEFNHQIGFELFTARSLKDAPNEAAWIKIVQEAHSHSAIGRQGGMQIVSVSPANADGSDKQRSLFHELGHALGFCHEQLHSGYPLDDEKVLRELLQPGSGETNFTLDAMVKSAEFKETYSFGPCDFSSMMMYGRFRRAAGKVTPGIEEPLTILSKYDVLIINNLYRRNQKPLSIDLPDVGTWCKDVRALIVQAQQKVILNPLPNLPKHLVSNSGAKEEATYKRPNTQRTDRIKEI